LFFELLGAKVQNNCEIANEEKTSNANNASNANNTGNANNASNQLCQSLTLAKCVPLKVTHRSYRKETEEFGRRLRGILVRKGY
jgi:hypothetical protein